MKTSAIFLMAMVAILSANFSFAEDDSMFILTLQ